MSRCIGCGCTNENACIVIEWFSLKTVARACHWLREDADAGAGVCSECAEYVSDWDRGQAAKKKLIAAIAAAA